MDTTDPNTGWRFPIVFLPGDLRAGDARELTHLDDEHRAAHRHARELLRDYAQRVRDTAKRDGRHPLDEPVLTSWEYLRDLMTVLLTNTDQHQP